MSRDEGCSICILPRYLQIVDPFDKYYGLMLLVLGYLTVFALQVRAPSVSVVRVDAPCHLL